MASITDIGMNPDFQYPSLNRKDLMSLSTVNSNDAVIRKFKQIDTKRDWSTNLFNLDIEGSVPKKFGVYNHKTDFINKLDDIERTSSKVLHFPLNKPEYNLSSKDIHWASPQINRNFITTRVTNPLEPTYKLSKVEPVEPIVPKFIRDNINVDGVEGAKPKKYFQWETRQTFDNSSIKGSSPKKTYVRNTAFSNIDYSDVTRDKFKTKRCVNPLDPLYEVKYKNGESYLHGGIEGSKPVTNSIYNYPDPFNLKTQDIDGTATGSKNRINKFTGQNYNLRTDDFRGASSGSLKRGIETKRQTNPLNPYYILPGQKELEQHNNPYGNTLFSKSAKVKKDVEKEKPQVILEGQLQSNNVEHRVENVRPESNKQDGKRLNPMEVLGFNNQYYAEDQIQFDPATYKKPDPFYGFVHDKYVVPSENKGANDVKSKYDTKKAYFNSNNINAGTQGAITVNSNFNQAKSMKDSVGGPKSVSGKSTNFSDYSKKTHAQMLDKFIQKNPSLD